MKILNKLFKKIKIKITLVIDNKVDEKKIVFLSHSGNRFDCNPLAIFEFMYEQNKHFNYVWILNKKLHNMVKKQYPNITLVEPHHKLALWHLKTCKIFINNQLHIGYYNKGLRRKNNQLFINTWHGSFGMKYIPFIDDKELIIKVCNDIDYFISNSSFESDVYKKTFNKNIKTLNYGHPRNDFLFSDINICNVKKYYNLDLNTKLVLYAPTKRQSDIVEVYDLDFKLIEKALKIKFGYSNVVFLVRIHRNNKFDFKKSKNVLNAFDYPNVIELIKECDILISDYSSIICDFVLTRKPCFVFAKDYNIFTKLTPLYHDYAQLPFGLAMNSEELYDSILQFDLYDYINKIDLWLKNVGCIEDGSANKKIYNFILNYLNCTPNEINTLNYELMKNKKHDVMYFTFRNIGDQIVLMRALEELYKKTNKRLLVGTLIPELWQNIDYIDVFILNELSMHVYDPKQFRILNKFGVKSIFITQEDFNNVGNKIIRTYGKSHIVANVASKLGLDGNICVDLNFNLTNTEKKFGRFSSKKQIAVLTGGLQRYKTYPFSKLQKAINIMLDKFKDSITIIQIGTLNDLPLSGVLDLRGRYNLREVSAILYNSDVFIGGIGGLMHLANAVKCPSVVLYTDAETDDIVNYNLNKNIRPKNNDCRLCIEGNHCPWTNKCLKKHSKYSCIDNISEIDIVDAVNDILNGAINTNPTIYQIPSNKKVFGIEEYKKTGFYNSKIRIIGGYIKKIKTKVKKIRINKIKLWSL